MKPDGLFLILELMHFAQEVLDPEGLRSAGQEVAPKELEMAKQLITALTSDWEPDKYEDQYQTALKAMIEEKVQNRPPSVAPAPAKDRMVGDILAILQQSLKTTAEKEKDAFPWCNEDDDDGSGDEEEDASDRRVAAFAG